MTSAGKVFSVYPNEDLLHQEQGSRPKSKTKRPGSANSTKTKNYDKGLKAAAQVYASGNGQNFAPAKGVDDEDYYTNMPREELIARLLEAKRKIQKYDSGIAQLKAENQRWEQEVTKQQRRIEALLNPSSTVNRNGQSSAETRKEIEKTIIVRQLKTQIMLLRGNLAERDAEIETLKKSQKSTHIVELMSEKEEYYLETLRLKQVVRELRETLQAERQRRDWDNRMAGGKNAPRIVVGAGNAIPKSEISPSSMPVRPYIVSAAAQGGVSSKAARPSSAGTNKKLNIKPPIPSTAVEILAAAAEPMPPKKSRPSSASSNKRRENRYFANDNAEAVYSPTSAGDGGKGAPFSSRAAAGAVAAVAGQPGKSRPSKNVAKGGGGAGRISENTKNRKPASASSAAQSSASAGAADDILLDSEDTLDVPPHIHRPPTAAAGAVRRNPFAPRTDVSSPPAAEVGASLSGSIPVPVPATEPIKLTSSGSASRIIAEIPSFKGQTTPSSQASESQAQPQRKKLIIETASSNSMSPATGKPKAQSLSDALLNSLPFKPGDRVEGQFRGGTSWYKARVKSANAADGTFHLIYDDGDEEKNTTADRIRPMVEPAPAATKQPNTNTTSTPSRDRQNVSVNSHAETPKVTLSPTKAGPVADLSSDVALPTGGKTEQQGAAARPAIADMVAKTAKRIRFKVGDTVEGKFEDGPDWYPAKISAVNPRGQYDLKYDDGDEEHGVAPERVRFAEFAGRATDEHEHEPDTEDIGDAVKAGIAAAASAHRDASDDKEFGDRDVDVLVPQRDIRPTANGQKKGSGDEKEEEKVLHGQGAEEEEGKDTNSEYELKMKTFEDNLPREEQVVCPDCSYPNYYRAYRCEMCNFLLDKDTEADNGKWDAGADADADTGKEAYSDRRTDEQKSDTDAVRIAAEVEDDVATDATVGLSEKPDDARTSGKGSAVSDDDEAITAPAATTSAAAGASAPSSSARKASKAAALKVGTKVEGNYYGEGKWYSGKITKVHGDATYDILYDDGDEETGVSESHIRTLDQSDTGDDVDEDAAGAAGATGAASASREKEREKEKVEQHQPEPEPGCRYYVGEEIESRYGGGLKYYPGTIEKSYPPKKGSGSVATYDVLYSDGDREKAVSEDLIKRRGEVDPPKSKAVVGDDGSGGTKKSSSSTQPKSSIPEGVKASDPSFLDKFLDDLSDDDDQGGDLSAGPAIYGNAGIGGIAEGMLNDGPTYGDSGGAEGGGADHSADYEDDFDA